MAEYDYKGTKIIVKTGDLTQMDVDAIVNPANSLLVMGGGVAGAIKRAGGLKIEEEARRKSPLSVGKAILTSAGKLKARYVIHAPTMSRPAMATNKECVKVATEAALRLANDNNLESIAFPGMGTGVGGVSYEDAAEAMIKETVRHIEAGSSIKEISFVGFSEELTRAFNEAWIEQSS